MLTSASTIKFKFNLILNKITRIHSTEIKLYEHKVAVKYLIKLSLKYFESDILNAYDDVLFS